MRIALCILALSAVALVAGADTSVTGKWTGNYKVTEPDGQSGAAILMLKQTGSDITGTVGPNEGELHAITKGKIEGDKIMLECGDTGLSIKFDLTLVGDRITGDVNVVNEGRNSKAKIDVTRAK
jgi:hypothetical protein